MLVGAKNRLFVGWDQVQVVLGSTGRTFIFFVSFNSDIDFDLTLGLFLIFEALMGYFLVQCFGFQSCS